MDSEKFNWNPQFGSIAVGSGISGGVRFGNEYMESSAAISYRGYQQYEVFSGLRPPKEWLIISSHEPWDIFQFAGIREEYPGLFLFGVARYRSYPQEDFYGLGPESSFENRTDFRFEEFSFHGVGGYQFDRHWRVDLRAGLLQPDIGTGTDKNFPSIKEVFSSAVVPGLDLQPDLFHFSSSAVADFRDDLSNPRKGLAAAFAYSRFDDLDQDLFQWNRYSLEIRGYLPLGSRKHVFASRIVTSFDVPNKNNRIPFYYQQTLGGSRTLRGFADLRFRDEHLLHWTGEYRCELRPFLELSGFLDAGKVFADASEFSLHDLEHSYGAGVGLKFPEKRVVFRFEIAHSIEDTRLLLQFGSSF